MILKHFNQKTVTVRTTHSSVLLLCVVRFNVNRTLHLFIVIFFSQTRLIIFLVGIFLHFSWNDLKLCFERYQQHHKKSCQDCPVYFRCFSFFLVCRRSNYFLNHQVPSFFSRLIKKSVYYSTIWIKIANVMIER